MRRPLLVAVLVLAAGLSVPAQQPPVTFKVEINYVEIDAVVTDASGALVRDLTKDDFEVLEEGTPQKVTAFTLVDVPIDRPDPPLFRTAPIEPDVATNHDPMNGRVFAIVLDDLQTDFRRSQRVKAAARQFIQRYVGANDLVAIVQTGGMIAGAQEFTSSRARMLAAVDKFAGQKIPSATLATIDDAYIQRNMGSGRAPRDLNEMERGAKARNTLSTLKNLADYLAGIRGRRKAILWFGEGIDYDINNVFEARDATTVREAMQQTIAAANRANVSFYGIDPRGVGAGMDETIDIVTLPDDEQTFSTLGVPSLLNEVRRAQDSLRTISTGTGGFAVVNRNDMTTAFARIVQENSSYYVLGYYSTNDKRDGKFRKLDVRVRRPGMQVRARTGYTAPSGRPPAANALGSDASPAVREALGSPLPTRGLNLSVFAAPFFGSNRKASISVIVEFDPGQLKFVEKDGVHSEDIEVVAIAVDAKGKMQDGGRDEAPLRLTQRNFDAVTRSGLRLTRRLDVPPGRYQLRVAARESNGATVGSVTLDLDVPDFSKAPLSMSGIALTSAAASRRITANPDPAFKDVLPASPTAMREFPAGDTLSLFTEIYDNQRAAHRVAIKTTVTADDGRVVFTSSDERKSDELRGAKGGGYGHTANIPLKDVPPGRYVLRVEAQTLLAGGATSARDIEFRVR